MFQVNECPCPKCGKTYSRAQSMLFHYTKHEEEEADSRPRLLSCRECNLHFRKKEKLDRHMEKVHPPPLECEHCSQVFHDPALLAEHMETHTRKMPYQCDQCDLTFNLQSSYNTHR